MLELSVYSQPWITVRARQRARERARERERDASRFRGLACNFHGVVINSLRSRGTCWQLYSDGNIRTPIERCTMLVNMPRTVRYVGKRLHLTASASRSDLLCARQSRELTRLPGRDAARIYGHQSRASKKVASDGSTLRRETIKSIRTSRTRPRIPFP